MKLEDLPGELWFLILSYLTPLEAFYSFNHVSHTRIQAILMDRYSIEQNEETCSSTLNISLAHLSLSMYNFAVSNVISSYSNVIQSFTLSNQRTPGQIESFLEKYSFKYDFTHLKSLVLIKPSPSELKVIIDDLSNVAQVTIQSTAMHTFEIETIQKILYGKPTMTSCSLSQFREDFIVQNSFTMIRKLIITSCDDRCFVLILNYFSLLETLSINDLFMSSPVLSSSRDLINAPILLKDFKLRTYNISFPYLQIIFSYLTNLRNFSLSVMREEGFDVINSDRWRMIITNYWPQLNRFQLYSEVSDLNSTDLDELYPRLSAFQYHSFWFERQISFTMDFYEDNSSFHLIFYSNPYEDRLFSYQRGYPVDSILPSKRFSSSITDGYRNVHRLLLTIYNNKQLRHELDRTSRYFPSLKTLTLQFQRSISAVLFGPYIEKIINVNCIKHLVLHGQSHTMSTLHELARRLSNMTKLTITSNHRVLTKQLFQRKNADVLSLLGDRLSHLNLLYDGVISHETVHDVRFNFPRLKSFSACIPHFEDFRDAIPSLIHQMTSLEYLHIGLECDNDKKNFSTQNMYEWFAKRQIYRPLKLAIDTYTNSIQLWF